ncbi:MAG: oligosaccharide flippase family protein [Deltaproteobacteria bacterium]|nr:oligosaccharide flippase family protein [Deltaproteobacteria bacterium]
MAGADSPSPPLARDRAHAAAGMRSAATASSVYFGAHALMIGASLISMPILTRLLSKPEYGLVSLLFSTVTILAVVGGMGFGEATVRFYGERRRDGTAAVRAVCDAMVGGAMVVGLLAAAVTGLVALWGPADMPANYVRCLGLGSVLVLIRIVSGVLYQIYRAQERAVAYAAIMVVARYATMVGAVALLLLRERTAFAVLAATVLVEAVAVVARFVDLAARGTLSRPRLPRVLLGSAVRYGAPLAIAGAAQLFLSYGDRLVIERLLGLDAVATYSVAYDVADRLGDTLLFPAQLAVVPIIFRLWAEQGRAATAQFVSRVLTYMIAILIPVAALYLVFSREIIVLLASAKYEESARLTPYLLPGVLLASLNFIVVVGHTIQKSTGRLAVNVAAVAALNMALNLLLVPPWGLVGAAVATTIAYAALVAVNYWQSRTVVAFRLDGAVIRTSMIAALVMVALVCGIGPVSSQFVVDLSLRASAGGLTAALAFVLLDQHARQWTWTWLQRKSR